MRFLILTIIITVLGACAVVTVPVKVATTAAGAAVDVATTTVDVIVPDGREETKDTQ